VLCRAGASRHWLKSHFTLAERGALPPQRGPNPLPEFGETRRLAERGALPPQSGSTIPGQGPPERSAGRTPPWVPAKDRSPPSHAPRAPMRGEGGWVSVPARTQCPPVRLRSPPSTTPIPPIIPIPRDRRPPAFAVPSPRAERRREGERNGPAQTTRRRPGPQRPGARIISIFSLDDMCIIAVYWPR